MMEIIEVMEMKEVMNAQLFNVGVGESFGAFRLLSQMTMCSSTSFWQPSWPRRV